MQYVGLYSYIFMEFKVSVGCGTKLKKKMRISRTDRGRLHAKLLAFSNRVCYNINKGKTPAPKADASD